MIPKRYEPEQYVIELSTGWYATEGLRCTQDITKAKRFNRYIDAFHRSNRSIFTAATGEVIQANIVPYREILIKQLINEKDNKN